MEDAIQNNLSKSQKFLREISVLEFRYSETIVFGTHSDFTYDSLCSDSLKFYPSLDFSSSHLKMYIIVINLVNVNQLIYCILINSSNQFHYFRED